MFYNTGMRFNEDIQIIPGGDPFDPMEVEEEPAYTALYLEDARRKGPISRYMVDVVLAGQPFFEALQGQLVLRNDKFKLGPKDSRQGIHIDTPLGDVRKWQPCGVQGVMVFGKGTGKTDVLRGFRVPYKDRARGFAEFAEVASIVEQQRAYYPVESHTTGTLIISNKPIFHGRGETFPGYRTAIDFGVLDPRNMGSEWADWVGLI